MNIIRVWFTKTGESSYISLLDLQRVMQRALKRSGFPVWYTMGFNPHIYMTFSAPLSLGQESMVESFDFKSEDEQFDWAANAQKLSDCLPQGIDITKIGKANMDCSEIAYAVYKLIPTQQHIELCKKAFSDYNESAHVFVQKKGKRNSIKTIDLKEYLPQIDFTNVEEITITLPAGNLLTINPALFLSYFSQTNELSVTAIHILRIALLTKNGENFD